MKTHRSPNKRGGFALIITLSLMILLTILAVGLLTLASISLRTSSQGQAIAEAKANARMAMLLAIGDLQKYSGKDTRITARADIISNGNPPVLGVWKSWEGTDHQGASSRTPGQPVAPNYSRNKEQRFLAWLVSSPGVSADSMAALPKTTAANRTVTLLGTNSVGPKDPAKRQIHLAPTLVKISNRQGAYAWWVSGENQKARLPKPYVPATNSTSQWSALVKTHTTVDTEPFDLDVILKDDSVKKPGILSPAVKAVSLKQIDLISANSSNALRKSQEYIHDLSANSIGLLTNTATGGWRKDLSLATENWNRLPSSGLPLFRVSPVSDIAYNRASSGNPYPEKSILYPWVTYRGSSGTSGLTAIYRFPAIGTWTNLANYATLYRSASPTAGAMSFNMKGVPINGDSYRFTHEPRILPVIARIQWIFSHRVRAGTSASAYDLEAVVNPVITLWNPYNVILNTTSNLTFRLNGSLPPVIDYKIGGIGRPKKFTLQGGAMGGATLAEAVGMYPGGVTYLLNSTISLKPGETQVFSADGASNNLKPGYRVADGIGYLIAKSVSGGSITTSVTFDSEYNDGGLGVGMYLNMDAVGSGTLLAYRMIYDKAAAQAFYPALAESKFPAVSVGQVLNTPIPFLSVIFGARMASNTHLASKGFVQSSPFVNYTAMGKKSVVESTIGYAYPGVLHNVNSPFEYSFKPLTAGNTVLPGIGNQGFIVTGFQSSDGLSRCVISEIPGRPLSSLGELQNWDARYENPIPPYAFNLVGNSDATPLIGKSVVVNSALRRPRMTDFLEI